MSAAVSFADFASTWNPFVEYEVTLNLKTIAGGVPKHKDLIEGWINATNKEKSDEERQKLVNATLADLPDVSEEKEAKSWVGFKQDGGGLFIEGRQVKAMLKESANIIKAVIPRKRKPDKKKKGKDGQETVETDNARGITNLKSKVAEKVFVVQDKIYLSKEGGKSVMKADELEERPIHVMTPQGPRSSIKRTDLVHDAEISFTVRLFDDGTIPEISLFAILSYAQHSGLGADRSQGMGTFKVNKVERTKESNLAAATQE